MWLDEGRFDLLTNQRRLTPPSSAARIDQLIEARAWNDACRTWTARMEATSSCLRGRRMACSLFRQPNLPVALDDTATASHEVLPLAILGALVEAHRRMSVTRGISLQVVPRARATSGYAVCCDNFS